MLGEIAELDLRKKDTRMLLIIKSTINLNVTKTIPLSDYRICHNYIIQLPMLQPI